VPNYFVHWSKQKRGYFCNFISTLGNLKIIRGTRFPPAILHIFVHFVRIYKYTLLFGVSSLMLIFSYIIINISPPCCSTEPFRIHMKTSTKQMSEFGLPCEISFRFNCCKSNLFAKQTSCLVGKKSEPEVFLRLLS
jgi:hypothetical protein